MKIQLEIEVQPEDLEKTLDELQEQFNVVRTSHKQIKDKVEAA